MKPIKLLPWIISIASAWSIGYAYNVYHGGIVGWLRKTYYNKAAIAASLESAPKRLIIVGGSGAHYTVNSEYLEEQLGFPVVNLALDGKLGLDVIFPTVLEHIRSGDIVLVIPEYLMLMDKDGLGEISVHFSLAINNPSLVDLPPKKFFEDTWILGITGLKSLVKSGVDLATLGEFNEYYSDPLTSRGDPTKTWQRSGDWWKLPIRRPISEHSIKRITEFKENVEGKGAHLVLSLPVIYGSNDEKTINNIVKTGAQLEKIAPLIYNPETLNVWRDSNLFADTHYHLQPEGRIKRSQEIITQLTPILEEIEQ